MVGDYWAMPLFYLTRPKTEASTHVIETIAVYLELMRPPSLPLCGPRTRVRGLLFLCIAVRFAA